MEKLLYQSSTRQPVHDVKTQPFSPRGELLSTAATGYSRVELQQSILAIWQTRVNVKRENGTASRSYVSLRSGDVIILEMSGDDTTLKRKKLPACDFCKTRRVLCHPQADGTSCPRCKEKNIKCTTTPTVRRRRRTKEELLKAASTLDSGNILLPQPEPSTTSISISAYAGAAPIVVYSHNNVGQDLTGEPVPVPPTLELPAEIVQDLFQTFSHSPFPTHPIIPLSKLDSILRLYSWNIRDIPSTDCCVLIRCIITLSSLISTNPFIIGPGNFKTDQFSILSLDMPLKLSPIPDLRPFGFRREPMFRRLWAEALWLANVSGITTRTSKDNAASCWLLGSLNLMVLGQGASAFMSAFVYHIRTLAEDISTQEASDILTYHAYMMRDVLGALTSGRGIQYTSNDEALLVPFTPEPLEQLLRTVIATKSYTPSQIFSTIHPFASHVIPLARRRPLDEGFLIQHLTSLDIFHSFLTMELDRIAEAIESALKHEPDFVIYLRACAYGFVASWGSLVFPLFEVLRDRSTQSFNSFGTIGARSGLVDSDSDVAIEQNNERLQMHFRHVRNLTCRTVLEVKDALRDMPTFQRMMHHSELVKWAMFLLDEFNVVDITREQCLDALNCFRDALQLSGFSYPDRTGIVDRLNEYIASYSLDNTLLAITSGFPDPGFGVGSWFGM
ncbi:hypothetical protein BDP27DRAFT_1341228, partial [Rhodocollybia butyracea]